MEQVEQQQADVEVSNQGTIVVFTLNTEEAKQFVADNLPLDSWQWLGPVSFAVDSRFASEIVNGMQEDGLTVE